MVRAATGAAAALSTAAVWISVPAANATSVTIGPTDLSGLMGQVGCSGTLGCRLTTFAQLTQPTAGVLLQAPADGMITSWWIRGAGAGNAEFALRVLRIAPDMVSFTGVGTSLPVPASGNDPAATHVTKLPIQAGDYIGVDTITPDGPSASFVDVLQPGSGTTLNQWSGGLPDGSTLAPTPAPPDVLLLNAVENFRPAVTAVTAWSGSTVGGETVTITGSNLDGATGISFGGTPAASFAVVSPTQINATTPAHAQGVVHVEVSSPGGISPATNADGYSFFTPIVPPPPLVLKLDQLAESARTWRQGSGLPQVTKARPPVGTTISFRLNESATVRLDFTRRTPGRLVAKRCVARSKPNQARAKCARTIADGTLNVHAHLGVNRVFFAGRLSPTRRLALGRHTVTVSAVDATGQRSTPSSLSFAIVP
jgi:IPT/TIG domain-containing protein